MGEVYTYHGTDFTIVDVEDTIEFTQRAEHGEPGGGTFTLDDEAGTQALIGQMDFSVTQSSCSFPLTFRGFIGSRVIGRGEISPLVGAGRKITVNVEDLNSMLGHLLIHQQAGMTAAEGGKRPAETVAARGAWLMASVFVDFDDNGRCDFPADKGMDKADYRYQHAGDVLADMALAAGGYNYHVNDWGAGPELTFRDDNASTADSSTLRISNVLSDASAVTLNPQLDATLTRSPAKVVSKEAKSYAKGTVVEERAATATAFNGERSGTSSNSNIKTAAKAREEAQGELWQLHTEEDVIECSIDAVTSAQVNLILAGMRIEAKFSHFVPEGYGSFTWFRVLERTVRPIVADGALYELDLKLSPQEPAEPVPAGVSIVQYAVIRTGLSAADLSLANPVTIGNQLVYAVSEAQCSGSVSLPNTAPASPRMGPTAWTLFDEAQADTPITSSTAAAGVFWKDAETVERTIRVNSYCVVAVYELAGADPGSATTDTDAPGTGGALNYDMTTLGTVADESFALAAFSLSSEPNTWPWDYANSYAYQTPNPNPGAPAAWTVAISKWNYDNYSLSAYIPQVPWGIVLHGIGDGATTFLPRVVPGRAGNRFGAVSVVIPPL